MMHIQFSSGMHSPGPRFMSARPAQGPLFQGGEDLQRKQRNKQVQRIRNEESRLKSLPHQPAHLIRTNSLPCMATQGKAQSVLGIVDDFKSRDILTNMHEGDRVYLSSHGDIVKAYALETADNKIITLQTGKAPKGYGKAQGNPIYPQKALKKLKQYWDKGNRLDAVNVSQGYQAKLSSLQRDFELPQLTADNILDFKETIVDGLHPRLTDVIEELQDLGRNVPVYVSAGNDGRETVNLYLLADNVIGVGARDAKGRIEPYSARGNCVKEWAPVSKHLTPAYDATGKFNGFSLAETAETKDALHAPRGKNAANPFLAGKPIPRPKHGEPQIPLSKTTSRKALPGDWWNETWMALPDKDWSACPMKGTSFASVQAAALAASKRGRLNKL